MKRLILFVMSLCLLFPSAVFASPFYDYENTPQDGIYEEQEWTYAFEHTKIKSVSYNKEYSAYVAMTVPDSEGYAWTLVILNAKKENPALTKALQKELVGKNVQVEYDDTQYDPEYYEIISFTIE